MWTEHRRLGWISLLCMALSVGCSSKPSEAPAGNEEGSVREKFVELQSALKSGDAEKLWALVNAKSQTDAERTAKDVRKIYDQASSEGKAKLEETLGLKGKELAELDGKVFLKSKRFLKKYHDVPDGKIERVVVQGDNATVYFLDPEGDKEKALFVRQDGQWKSWLTMPRVDKP